VEEGEAADQGDRSGEVEEGGANEPTQERDQISAGDGETAVGAQVRADQARRFDVPEQDVKAKDVQEQGGQTAYCGHRGQPKGPGLKGDLRENRDPARRRGPG